MNHNKSLAIQFFLANVSDSGCYNSDLDSVIMSITGAEYVIDTLKPLHNLAGKNSIAIAKVQTCSMQN
jgi:hypothetical protein